MKRSRSSSDSQEDNEENVAYDHRMERRKSHEADCTTFDNMLDIALEYKDEKLLTALYKFQQRAEPEYSDDESEEDECFDLTKICVGSHVYQYTAGHEDKTVEKFGTDWIVFNAVSGEDYSLNAMIAAHEYTV